MLRQEEEFDRLLIALGQPDWLLDERFSTPEKRLEHAQLFTQMIREAIAQRSSGEWMALFRSEDIPAALVAQFQDLPNDPQVLANDMAMPAVENVGMARVVRDPINVDGVARVGATKAPEIGEHSDEILTELGFSAEQVREFKQQGII